MPIYLDHAAATPVHPKVLEAMLPYFAENFYNPSAPYLAAKRVREDYEDAKNRLAHCIGAKGNDLVITSGATESINLAFTVLKTSKCAFEEAHLLVSSTEHASVLACAKAHGNFDEIAVDKHGLIDLKDLKSKIKDNTVLISVALANNELGTIQPLSEIAEIVKEVRKSRLEAGNRTPLFLHSDASQALSLIDISVARLGVDMLTLNAAKVYGPKGIGALYVSHDVKLNPISHGGGQELGLRSGTENVPSLIGFAKAAELAKEHLSSSRKTYENLVKILKSELETCIVKPKFLGLSKKSLANFCSVCFDGIDAERLIYMLEDDEIYISTGAACAASKGQKSKTLTAIGLTDSEIAGSLRISLGSTNDETQIREAATKIKLAVETEYHRIHA